MDSLILALRAAARETEEYAEKSEGLERLRMVALARLIRAEIHTLNGLRRVAA